MGNGPPMRPTQACAHLREGAPLDEGHEVLVLLAAKLKLF